MQNPEVVPGGGGAGGCWRLELTDTLRQNNWIVISLNSERGEFKPSVGGLSNNIPYTVQKLSTILQSAYP